MAQEISGRERAPIFSRTASRRAITGGTGLLAAALLATWSGSAAAAIVPAAAWPSAEPESRADAETCLAQAISYEAGREPQEGQEAVAQVVLNRLRDPAYPKTVCGVVFQGSGRRTGCQFTFTCDGSLTRRQVVGVWANALRIAQAALDGQTRSAIGAATHYHAYYVQPAWAGQLTRIARIGAHIFYAGPAGGAGRPGAALPAIAHADAPAPAVFSAWGLQTAVLVRSHGLVEVAAPGPATPPPGPPMAGRADR